MLRNTDFLTANSISDQEHLYGPRWEAFISLPVLACLGSVLTSLPPTFGLNEEQYVVPGLSLMLSPVLLLLFSRCLGQMIGPIVIPGSLFEHLVGSKVLKIGTLVTFFALYVAAYLASSLMAKCSLIIPIKSADEIVKLITFLVSAERVDKQAQAAWSRC